ncbi:MAG: hypothetical protein Q8S11_14775 [Daejeonella sp.]|uniref:hypothetical protein n=1 Tax=Daejeonella sp. TaxID=2805397 RepID=UPI002735A0EC|nr:hypothetical protein [Daejeonella sp.]MDP3469601.1 hypothetical protein [Daejeonella sp.]
MKEDDVKSGKEILDAFFTDIATIENVDKEIAKSLTELYFTNKLSDKNVVNELQKLRLQNGDKD